MIKFNKKLIKTPKSETLYVAVSMGEDSVALSLFLAMGYRKLCFLHVDHNTEYSSTAAKAFKQFVFQLNAERQITHSSNPKPKIEYKILKNELDGRNMSETELRDVRYGLINSAVPSGAEVVVCHHLQDCVESYLMNCFNGREEFVPIPVRTNRSKYTVVRPFILTTKESILKFLQSEYILDTGIVVQDPSNEDTSIRRNWVRHVVLPVIKQRYVGIDTIVRKKVESKIKEIEQLDDF